ncbi:hypothetical protein CPC08DRAFT_767211 [Agrocybe pediades]|nr:hypothetical protein CPC08DRAFT_767211 [Agrocybe pediades]
MPFNTPTPLPGTSHGFTWVSNTAGLSTIPEENSARTQPATAPRQQQRIIASSSDDLFHPTSAKNNQNTFILPDLPSGHSARPLPNPHHGFQQNQQLPDHIQQFPNFNQDFASYPHQMPYQPAYMPFYQPQHMPYQQQFGYSFPHQSQYPAFAMPNAYNPYLQTYYPRMVNNFMQPAPAPVLPPAPPPPAPALELTEPKPLPNPAVTHIPILKSNDDFPTWESQIISSIQALGLYGHLLDPAIGLLPGTNLMEQPCPRPVLSLQPTVTEIYALRRWEYDEATVCYVLQARLSDAARSILPPAIAHRDSRLAYILYKTLVQFYGSQNFQECADRVTKVSTMHCRDVPDYVREWNAAITNIVAVNHPGSMSVYMNSLAFGLPDDNAYSHLKATINTCIATLRNKDDIAPFHTLCQDILTLHHRFKRS